MFHKDNCKIIPIITVSEFSQDCPMNLDWTRGLINFNNSEKM